MSRSSANYVMHNGRYLNGAVSRRTRVKLFMWRALQWVRNRFDACASHLRR